jgi:hypothetical protein
MMKMSSVVLGSVVMAVLASAVSASDIGYKMKSLDGRAVAFGPRPGHGWPR